MDDTLAPEVAQMVHHIRRLLGGTQSGAAL
jgi:hypothetical protein